MNAQAAEALYEAERKGVKQIRNFYSDTTGGRCALGVIQEALTGNADNFCIDGVGVLDDSINERGRIARLNDEGLTFSEIARKLGPDSA